jgi:hypothetical protein
MNAPGASGIAGRFGGGLILIPDFANTTTHKSAYHFGGVYSNTGASQQQITVGVTHWSSTAAIASVLLGINNPNFDVGSRISTYGLG